MRVKNPSALIDEFLGSTHIFAQVVENIVQENLVKQASDGTLTYSQFKLLKLVTMSDLISIGDVAAFLSISNAAASKAVDRLVRKRLIQRAEFAKDRRAVQLSPTEAGARIIGTYEELKARHLPKIFSAVQASRLKGVSQLLDDLSVRLVERAPERARTTCLQCGIFYRRSCLMRLQANRSCFYHDRRTLKSNAQRHEKTPAPAGHR